VATLRLRVTLGSPSGNCVTCALPVRGRLLLPGRLHNFPGSPRSRSYFIIVKSEPINLVDDPVRFVTMLDGIAGLGLV
jgi:hypothetical protein